jgi:acetoin:2,6-dichlorophenolindophenol oxidoreductase subunit alpha
MSATIDLHAAYAQMSLMRAFEEAVGQASASGEIHGEMHLAIGQEGIAAGIEPLLQPDDAVVSTHRPHLHALIAGVDPVRLLGELFEREDGICHGKGGHMHLFEPERRFMCTGIVGASLPLAAGYAFERSLHQPGSVTLAVMGDGAANHGTFSESLNLAALWNLPVIFLCEDNGYAISVTTSTAAAGEIHRRGEAYGVPGCRCDGTDPTEVLNAAKPAFERARSGGGPSLVVATAYRFRGHYEGDIDHYRTPAERGQAMAERDPLINTRVQLLASGAQEDELDRLDRSAAEQVEQWVAQARAMPWPPAERAQEGVFV